MTSSVVQTALSVLGSSAQKKKLSSNRNVFLKGSIIKVYLKNFLTFDDFSFRANPKLNVVLGPNGTGKSSIVCAICLGLAGKTSSLGRAKQLADYIKHGKDKAVIEIDICDENENHKIRREIILVSAEEMKSITNWSINGEPKTVKQVRDLVEKFNIQISNLCQFLPQERVADFAKMNKVEMLESTELAICSQQMIDDHTWLKEHQSTLKDLESRRNEDSSHLEKLKQKNQMIEKEVIRYKERLKLKEKLETIHKKIAWTVYEDARKTYMKHKQELKDLHAKKMEADSKTLPLVKKKDKISKEVQLLNTKQTEKSNETRKIAEKTKNLHSSLEEKEDQYRQLAEGYEVNVKQEQDKKKKLTGYKEQIKVWELELENLEDSDVQSQVDDISHKIGQTLNKIGQTNEQIYKINGEKENMKYQLKGIDRKIAELENLGNRRLEFLQKNDIDCYKATVWLRENRNLFKMTIYEPIMLVINMKEVKFAELVENHIAMRDLYSFVCEDINDNTKFIMEIREKRGLKVNVVLAPRDHSGKLKTLEQYQPRRSITALKQWGFSSFLLELFEAPPGVMAYLCKQYQVHDTPIGTARTKEIVDQVVTTSNLQLFYIPTHKARDNRTVVGSRYSVKGSKYSNEKITANRALNNARFLNIRVDPLETQQLVQQKEGLIQSLKEFDVKLSQIKEENRKWEKSNHELCSQKKELQQKKNQRRNVENKIRIKEKSCDDLLRSFIDLDEFKKNITKSRQQICLQKSDIVKEFVQSISACVNSTIEKGLLVVKYTSYIDKKSKLEHDIRNMKLNNVHILKAIERVEALKSESQELAKQLLGKAQKETGVTLDHFSGFNILVQQVFSDLPTETAELESLKHELQAKLDCYNYIDPSVFDEFKGRKKEVEDLERKISGSEEQLRQRRGDMEMRKDRWLRPLNKLISKINHKFAAYFASMNCAGEVDIHTDNPDEFDKYGIRIRVKFRSNASLQELNPYRQSGGERSVSTMLYLIAMQSMFVCPFRVVDEINQGMDPANERKVYEIIVNSCAQQKSPQYFLFSPKLLPNLAYNEHMSVHVIYNGPSVLTHSEWRLSRFIRKRSMLKYEDEEE